MNLRNGWGDVQAVGNGIRWMKKLKLFKKVRAVHFNIQIHIDKKRCRLVQLKQWKNHELKRIWMN